MQDKTDIKPVKMLFVIVDRGKGKTITKLLNNEEIACQFAIIGKGTAPNSLHDYFGFGESTKDIVCGIIEKDKVNSILDLLKTELRMDKPNSGIAFTIPIKSISSLTALKLIMGTYKEN